MTNLTTINPVKCHVVRSVSEAVFLTESNIEDVVQWIVSKGYTAASIAQHFDSDLALVRPHVHIPYTHVRTGGPFRLYCFPEHSWLIYTPGTDDDEAWTAYTDDEFKDRWNIEILSVGGFADRFENMNYS